MIEKNKFLLVINIIIVLVFSGCTGARELKDLAMVSALGIDKGEEDELKITSQIINLSKSGNTQEGGSGISFENITKTSTNIFDAIRNTTLNINQKLYYPHMKVIVLGEEAVKNNFTQNIDFFIRDPEIRSTTGILISRDKASEILKVIPPSSQTINGFYIDDLIKVAYANSMVTEVTLQDITEILANKTTSLTVPYIVINEHDKLELKGMAIIKRERLVGKLNYKESRGLLWVLGKAKSGIIKIKDEKGQRISLEMIRSKSKVTSQIKGNQITMTIKVTEVGNVGEYMGSQQCTPEVIKKCIARKEKVITEEIKTTIEKAQNLNADIFGFGQIIHQEHPQRWKEIKDDWDQIFPRINTKIIVKSAIERVGIINKTIGR
jgi:spore germination protein KC